MLVLLTIFLCLLVLNFNIIDINIFMSYALLFFIGFFGKLVVEFINNFLELNPLLFLIITFITGIYALIK
jgi:hypothetical protein